MTTINLRQELAEKIRYGLQKKSYTKCSLWAKGCRVMGNPFPGPWTFRHHPWLEAMHDSDAGMNIGQKAAQMGYTELALNRTFYNIDIRGMDCLYVLPAKTPDASDFSAARFDAALELSDYLARLFSDVKNVGHKRAGAANLYIRGGRARSGLKSIPVGFIVLDEIDEMPAANIPLALERMAGQVHKEVWQLSTPTIPKTGINRAFQDSTQQHFYFKCPGCSRFIELQFPQNFKVIGESPIDQRLKESHTFCDKCQKILPHETKIEWLTGGQWEATRDDRDVVGWYINQLYSMTVEPAEIAKKFIMSTFDRSEEQEFWNSKMGLPHVVEGAGVSEQDIINCTRGYTQLTESPGNVIVTMGIDVGKWLHYEIDEWKDGGNIGADFNIRARARVIKEGKVLNFEELDHLMYKYRVLFAVIDSQPERRKSLEFAMRFFGHVRVCSYEQGILGKTMHLTDDSQAEVKVDRTSWLDLSLGRFRNGTINLPTDLSQEYKDHIKAQVRVYLKDKNGNPVGRYVNTDDDHFGHARNYSEIAYPMALSLGKAQNIPAGTI